MGAAVHRPGLSGDRLAEVESSWFGLVTALGAAVHHPSLSGDQLTVAKSSKLMGGTDASGVHRLYEGGAPPDHRHW